MGQAWSELKKQSKRKQEDAVDDFFPKLSQLVKDLPSFRQIDRYCTTDYVMNYARITLDGETSLEDEKLILKYQENNPRDNWSIEIKTHAYTGY